MSRSSRLMLCVLLAALPLLIACGGTTPSSPSSNAGSAGGSATFVFVANAVQTGPAGSVNTQFTGAGGISELRMAANGTLTPVSGSPLAFNSNMPMSLAADPLGRFIFGASASDIYTFSINPSTGALTQVAIIAAPSFSAPMVVDHAGSFLYALTTNGLGVFSIASKGALTPVQTLPVVIGQQGLTLDNAGQFLYVSGGGKEPSAGTTSFSINSTSGMLTQINSIPVGQYGVNSGIAVNPAGNFVYGQTVSPRQTLVFSSISGRLTLVDSADIGSIDDFTGGTVLMHPSGKFMYETMISSLAAMSIAADGGVTTISPYLGYPLPELVLWGQPPAIALSPGGGFLLASQAMSNSTPSITGSVVSVFAVDTSTGNLSAIQGSPFTLDVANATPNGSPNSTVAVNVRQP